MKIVYFCKLPIPSRMAASIHVMKMCQALAQNGHDVVLVVLSENNEVRTRTQDFLDIYRYYNVDKCFEIIQQPVLASKMSRIRYLLSTLLAAGAIFYRLFLIKPDIVFGRDLSACFFSALMRKPVIFESHFPVWHGVLESFMFKKLIALSSFKRLVVISESLRQVYLNHYDHFTSSKVIVAHDAADNVDDWSNNTQLLGKNGLNVGYVGHLYKGKGVEVIQAVAPKMLDVDFHIIGGLDKDIAYWKSKIHSPNVFFYGFVRQELVSPYILSLDVCLLPNQRCIEAFGASSKRKTKNISDFTSPLKMFEYMAHKKPIIASDLPVLREVLNDGVALLVVPEDIEGWCSAVEKLKEEKLRHNLAESAYQLFNENYTWKKRAELVLRDFSVKTSVL